MSGVVRVKPKNPSNTHDISLSDGSRTWGIKLTEGPRAIQEISSQPSNIRITGGGEKYGDFDPAFSHIEMRDWTGGRGGEKLVDDPSKFYDSLSAWTLTPGWWHQAPQWYFAEGTSDAGEVYMPGSKRHVVPNSVQWTGLLSTAHYARSFTADFTSTGKRVQFWARRVGNPGALTVQALNNISSGTGRPGSSAPVCTTTVSATAIEEGPSALMTVTLSTGLTISSGTKYWVGIYASSAGTPSAHWELGYNSTDATGSTTLQAAAGTSGGWTSTGPNFFFRIAPAQLKRKAHFFEMDRQLYMVDQKDDRTASDWYMNGARGEATASAASTIALTDTGQSWAANIWSNSSATVATIRGTGLNQKSKITSNTSVALTVALPVAPTTTTEYVVYDTEEWQKLSSAGFSSAGTESVVTVAVPGTVAYVGKGASTCIGTFTWNSSLHAWGLDATGSASNAADQLCVFDDPVDGPQLWRAVIKSTGVRVSRAAPKPFGSTITFTTGILVKANDNRQISRLIAHDDGVYVFAEDALFVIKGDRPTRVNVGLEAQPSSNTGRAALSQNLYLYFGWSHSTERLYGNTLDDVGLWKGSGLPSGRQGFASEMMGLYSWVVQSVNAGSTGTSAVFLWNGQGWHEIFRAWSSGYEIDSVYLQSNPTAHPRLWIHCGGDIVTMPLPMNTLNPVNDGTMHYQHEGYVVSPIIDMGVAEIPKLFAELHCISRDLNSSGNEVHVEYQIDEGVGSTSWTAVGRLTRAPSDSAKLMRGDKKSIRVRTRALTANSANPTRVEAVVLKSVARTPVKRQWNIRARSGSFQVTQQGLSDTDPDDFYLWLRKSAEQTSPLRMKSAWAGMNDIRVYADFPTVLRQYTTPSGEWGADYNIVLREI